MEAILMGPQGRFLLILREEIGKKRMANKQTLMAVFLKEMLGATLRLVMPTRQWC
jgi:hypothetical protein